ncbi:hypothetical protein GP486_002851 [Trichoglossum hirsutum]|uniref:Uncharacterized protein n=1 Tax=Trichoglossum hirsutum TaxID=265104 RepID=A0A9P8LE72_9PEZI|nr:hypothetical protein GP486_002851 [Trichoglossum hirsutum]
MEPSNLRSDQREGAGLADAQGDGGDKRSSIVPPYWKDHRTDSDSASENLPPTLITLEDHTEEPSDKSTALWAKSVAIQDYVVVSGSRTGVGAYVVWNCTVDTLEGGVMKIRKRFDGSAMPDTTNISKGTLNLLSSEISY